MSAPTIAVENPTGAGRTLWQISQVGGLVATAVLLAGLIAQPQTTLNILWNVVVPVLPAVFLVNPLLWRNACPLATLNKLTGDRLGSRRLSVHGATWAGALGVVLLYVMVPARRVLFNVDGTILAATIVAVALLAILGGVLYSAKAGFCNAICPVLPVERLYGQRPLANVTNARCYPCSMCVGRGCVDLSPTKSIAQTLGRARRSHRWLLTPFGAFAASFPGFVLGYFTTVDGPLSTAGSVYVHIFTWAAASYVVVALVSLLRPGRNEELVTLLAAVAVGSYYWFVSPTVVEAVGGFNGSVVLLRVATLALIALWLVRGMRAVPHGNNHQSEAAS
ncbi:MAG: hypothetical protein OEO23_09920 [Gemmatimonadota bacterium]|nr:hypothetical protein [Gemmatimonadota bacterium]